MKLSRLLLCAAALVAALTMTPDMRAQAPAAAPAKAPKAAAKAPPTDAEIADAKTKDLVWVNTNTKKYHKSDAALYGKTKHGQFMTEADAEKAGYKAAQETGGKKAKKATKATATQ